MRPRAPLVAALATALSCCAGPGPTDGDSRRERPQPPNIVLILTDDQGFGDFGRAGHAALRTPNLDRLAAESPQVERFYVSPVCSPTRASLMTGRWNQRTRVVDTWIGRSMMDPDEETLAEVLADAGYATGIFGKWHLGDCYPLRAMDQGFKRSLVHRGGGLAQPSEPPENARRYTDSILFRDGRPEQVEGFCTDVYFDAALEFLDEALDDRRPFFAYVATNAPHDPFHDVPPEEYAYYAAPERADALRSMSPHVDREARICAMVENIDRNVGRLLAHLAEREVERETIVVFLCDNGPIGGRFNAGLRGAKAQPYEGGVRTPLFVRWPGRLAPETTVDRIGAHVDLMPTLLALAAVEPRRELELDGRDLSPLLRGEAVEWPARHLFLQAHRGNEPASEHHFAVVGQDWKLVRASGFGRGSAPADHPFELYRIDADPGETTDLSGERPEVLAELRAAYADWFDDVSTTRPHNFDPPRIVVGHPRAPVTVLTKQDRRHDVGEGWDGDGDGRWWLSGHEAGSYELVLLFTEPTAVDRARLQVDSLASVLTVGDSGLRLSAGDVQLPAGPFDLSVELEAGGEAVFPHQLELRRR